MHLAPTAPILRLLCRRASAVASVAWPSVRSLFRNSTAGAETRARAALQAATKPTFSSNRMICAPTTTRPMLVDWSLEPESTSRSSIGPG